MSTETKITEQELNEIAYGDLKAKFEELGVPQAWKGGKKKEDLIASALEALAEVKANISSDADKKGDGVTAEEKDPSIEEGASEEIEYSQDQIKGILKTIKQNLLCGVPSHRSGLLASQEKFEGLLEG